jgi:hypothetical protein
MRTTQLGRKDPGYERQQRNGRTPIRGVSRGNVIRPDQGDQNLAGRLHGVFCGRFILGGRDRQIGPATPLDAPSIQLVDARLPASDFDELLRLGGRAAARGPAPGEPTRCILFPNSQTIVNSGPFASRKKQRLVNSLGREQLFIDVDNDSIRVIDPESHAVDATAPVSRITATPLSYEMRDTETGHVSKTPALTMSVPGVPPLTFGCPTSNGGSGDFRGPAACSSSKTLRPTYSRPPTG